MPLLEYLMEIGLTRHEAQLYLLLSAEGSMTGYEAAKLSGISRSNAYLALAGLVDKGGATRAEGDVRRFAPVEAKEFCRNKRRRQELVIREILRQMPAPKAAAEPFLTIKGESHIIDKMKNMLADAKKRVYLSLAAPEVELIRNEMLAAQKRGLKVVLITDPPLVIPGIINYHAAKTRGQIRLIADSAEVLTGEIGENEEASCLYSKNNSLVTLFKEAMVNEIKLIEASHHNILATE